MSLFNRKKIGSIPVAPPQDDFGTIKRVEPEQVSAIPKQPVEVPKEEPKEVVEEVKEVPEEQEESSESEEDQEGKIVYIPRSISQEEINNLVIENNYLLKKLLQIATA